MRQLYTVLAVLVLSVAPASLSAQKYNGVIDKTVAVIGDDVIMLSDIENEVQVARSQGMPMDRNSRCELLETMLQSKLFVAQARKDSLVVNADNVEAELNNRVINAETALGGEKAVEEYFSKSMFELKNEWRVSLNDQMLMQQMQQEIAKKVPELTPVEVKDYVRSIPDEDLPIIPTQYRLSHIVLYPDKESAALAVRERLLEFRERIMNGEKFSTLARIYSQDQGSASRGGELGLYSGSMFWPAFTDAAISLKPGQVSQIVETPDGFHLIQLISKDGDMFNARHILLKPVYTSEDRSRAFSKLDSIRTAIVNDSITFFLASRLYSEDKTTRANGGQMADENTGSSYFEKDQLKPSDYNVIRNMAEGEISEPFESLDNEGRSGNTIYKIIRVDKIIPSHTASFESDYNALRSEASDKAMRDAIEKFIVDKQKAMFIRLDPDYRGCEWKYPGWGE